eukprot:2942587-Pyramimonas_sp.AAC.1
MTVRQAGHDHCARLKDMITAPAGPRTLGHAGSIPTSCCCRLRAFTVMDPVLSYCWLTSLDCA